MIRLAVEYVLGMLGLMVPLLIILGMMFPPPPFDDPVIDRVACIKFHRRNCGPRKCPLKIAGCGDPVRHDD